MPEQNGSAAVSVSEEKLADAINAAIEQAGENRISITVGVQLTQAADSLAVTLPAAALDKLIDKNVKELKLTNSLGGCSLDLEAMKEIRSFAAGDLVITAKQLAGNTLSEAAQAAIGSRPVLDFTMTSGGRAITSLGSGSASVQIPYTLSDQETAGRVQAVYVDPAGKVQWLADSSYDIERQCLLFTTGHFSAYGVGCRAEIPALTDLAEHWAKEDMEFAVSRGLLDVIGTDTFRPDSGATGEMLVTALERLAGLAQGRYQTTVTDALEGSLTREKMAALMADYAEQMGWAVPRTREAVSFADEGGITAKTRSAVKNLQMAGILNGKNGNRFDPQGTATRAEIAAMLHRFVALRIDLQTAQGLDVNDSGSVLLYENGKQVKSQSRTVNGRTYAFNANGEGTLLPPQ